MLVKRSMSRGQHYTRIETIFGFDFVNGYSGIILYDWKNTLSNSDRLINWGAVSGPCGSNPRFHVLCNAGHVQ